jgi:cysteinyl-tRNA synthetase
LRGIDVSGDADAVGEQYRDRFLAAMDDDFNTPEALSVLFELAREINRLRDSNVASAANHAALMRELGGVIGLLQQDAEAYLKSASGSAESGLSDAEVDSLIEARVAARANKDWAAADRIRDQLTEGGIELEDGAAGTSWRRS